MIDKDLECYLDRRHEQALSDAKGRIVIALKDSHQGLRISQITSIVKISAKLAKEALADLNNVVYEAPNYKIKQEIKKMKFTENDKLKSRIKTTTVVTKDLFIGKDELAKFLTEHFNLKFIEFFEDGSVHLSEVVDNKA